MLFLLNTPFHQDLSQNKGELLENDSDTWSELLIQIENAKPGDIINIPEGNYNKILEIELYGNVSDPIYVIGKGLSTVFRAIRIRGVNIVLANISIKNHYGEDLIGLEVKNAINVSICSVFISGGAATGLRVGFNSTNIKIEDSIIYDRNGLERLDWNAYLYFTIGSLVSFCAIIFHKKRDSLKRKKWGMFLYVIFSLLALSYINPEVYPFNYHPGLDAHGIAIQAETSYISVLNCTIWGNSGDSIQVLNPPSADKEVAHHIFIQNNTLYGNRENSIDIKDSEWIYIENNRLESSKIRPTFDTGVILTVHFSVSHVRIINNSLAHGVIGMVLAHSSGKTGYVREENSTDYIVERNIFYDINSQGFPIAVSSSAIFVRKIVNLTIVDNIFSENIDNLIDLSYEPEEWVRVVNNSIVPPSVASIYEDKLPFYPEYEEYVLVSGELLIFLGASIFLIEFLIATIRTRTHFPNDSLEE